MDDEALSRALRVSLSAHSAAGTLAWLGGTSSFQDPCGTPTLPIIQVVATAASTTEFVLAAASPWTSVSTMALQYLVVPAIGEVVFVTCASYHVTRAILFRSPQHFITPAAESDYVQLAEDLSVPCASRATSLAWLAQLSLYNNCVRWVLDETLNALVSSNVPISFSRGQETPVATRRPDGATTEAKDASNAALRAWRRLVERAVLCALPGMRSRRLLHAAAEQRTARLLVAQAAFNRQEADMMAVNEGMRAAEKRAVVAERALSAERALATSHAHAAERKISTMKEELTTAQRRVDDAARGAKSPSKRHKKVDGECNYDAEVNAAELMAVREHLTLANADLVEVRGALAKNMKSLREALSMIDDAHSLVALLIPLLAGVTGIFSTEYAHHWTAYTAPAMLAIAQLVPHSPLFAELHARLHTLAVAGEFNCETPGYAVLLNLLEGALRSAAGGKRDEDGDLSQAAVSRPFEFNAAGYGVLQEALTALPHEDVAGGVATLAVIEFGTPTSTGSVPTVTRPLLNAGDAHRVVARGLLNVVIHAIKEPAVRPVTEIQDVIRVFMDSVIVDAARSTSSPAAPPDAVASRVCSAHVTSETLRAARTAMDAVGVLRDREHRVAARFAELRAAARSRADAGAKKRVNHTIMAYMSPVQTRMLHTSLTCPACETMLCLRTCAPRSFMCCECSNEHAGNNLFCNVCDYVVCHACVAMRTRSHVALKLSACA